MVQFSSLHLLNLLILLVPLFLTVTSQLLREWSSGGCIGFFSLFLCIKNKESQNSRSTSVWLVQNKLHRNQGMENEKVSSRKVNDGTPLKFKVSSGNLSDGTPLKLVMKFKPSRDIKWANLLVGLLNLLTLGWGWMHHLASHSIACFLTRGDLDVMSLRGF